MTDIQIIELYWARSEQAIAATADAYGSYCTTIAWNILQNREDAEECVSDTWHKAWNSMPPERPSLLKVWLGKITRNLALDRWRANRAEKRGGRQTDVLLSELEGCLADSLTPEKQTEDREVAHAISAWLRTQPATVRSVFIRRYWYGDSVSQIAHTMGMSQPAVKSALFRARAALKIHLEEEGLWI